MKLPNLDDKTYAELVAEAIAQIPLECPEWTDHNPTDTGIILIELLAWLTEMTLYQVNQIPDESYASFVSLLKGQKWELYEPLSPEIKKNVQSEIQKTLLELRRPYRAVTIEDYEKLVLEDWNQLGESKGPKIARVKAIAQRNLEESDINTFAKGHISLVVVPEPVKENNNNNGNNKYKELWDFLDERRLLTTPIHIVEPSYVSVTIKVAELVIIDGAKAEAVKEKAQQEVTKFFHPLQSGKYWQGKGWPFGKQINLSDLYRILDNLEGVDYVKTLEIENNNLQEPIILADNQLVKFNLEDSKFTIIVEVGNERKSI